MASLISSILLFLLTVTESRTDCSIQGDNDCNSDETCSLFDLLCYRVFNASDYQSSTAYNNVDKTIEATPTRDLSPLLDYDNSTGVSWTADNQFYFVEFTFPGNGYWVHAIETFVTEGIRSYAIDINDEGAFKTFGVTNTGTQRQAVPLGITYPLFINNLTLRFWAQVDTDIWDLNVYGAYDTPQPTDAPSPTPTDISMAPTASPTGAPSMPPTPAPTDYPTPDVCDDIIVKQSCCGNYDYTIQEDKRNIRDASLTTCEYTFTEQCCGTLGGWYYFTAAPDYYYGCNNDINQDGIICRKEFYNTSLNATDNIYGYVINATENDFEGVLASTDATEAELNDPANNYCTCDWTVYECEGEDVATCGSMEDYEKLNEACWGNETIDYWTEDDVEDFVNDTCYKSLPYQHLLWEPCSEESFIGSVTEIKSISTETILDGDCSCEYYIRDCRVVEDQTKTECPMDESGNIDCTNGCILEVANPCCSTGLDWNYENYAGVTPQIDPTTGLPIEDSWTCNNNQTELCPDIFEGSRLFTAESRVDWYYDGETGEIVSWCGCLYEKDECDLPTNAPSADPTAQPSVQPSESPTPSPTSQEEGTDDVTTALLSTSTFMIISFISLFL